MLIQHRGKDSTVRIWELPEASDDGSPFSQPLAKPPIVLRIQAKSETEGTDITSLAWNPQGTLVAVGGFDSVLRIWTKSGDEYMTNPQHRVCAAISILVSTSTNPACRVQSSEYGFQNPVNSC